VVTDACNTGMDIVTHSPTQAIGPHVLSSLKSLGFPRELPDLILSSRASAYRVATRSPCLAPLMEMLEAARSSDFKVLHPRYPLWRHNTTVNYIWRVKRATDAIPGIPADDGHRAFQRRVYNFLHARRGQAAMAATIGRRVEYYRYPEPGIMADMFIVNCNAIAKKLRPFVVASVLRAVCNAWTTSRRFRGSSPHCRLGCQAVGGDDIRHYPYCPVFLNYIERHAALADCSWVATGSLSYFMLLHEAFIDDLIRTAVWVDVLTQAVNWRRHGVRGTTDRIFHARLRTVLAKHSAEVGNLMLRRP